MLRIIQSMLACACLGGWCGGGASAFSPPPYQPPFDYSELSYEELSAKLRSPVPQQRESSMFYMVELLQHNEIQPRDGQRTYEALKRALQVETDHVTQIRGWDAFYRAVTAQQFTADKEFWLTVLTNTNQTLAVQIALGLVTKHEARWAKPAVLNALTVLSDEVQVAACQAVAALRLTEAEPVLRKLVLNQKEMANHYALKALGTMGTPASLPDLATVREIERKRQHTVEYFDEAIRSIRTRFPNAN